MKKAFLFAAVLLAASLSHAQTPIAEVPNAVSICTETDTCVITAVSNPAAVLQFGAASTWCQSFTAGGMTFPATVAYYEIDPQLCSYDPAPNVVKTLAAQQAATAYTVSYTLAGVAQTLTVPALTGSSTPPPTSATCGTSGNPWYEIGGGTPGETATVPAGTVYMLAGGPCTVASSAATLDLSAGSLAIQLTATLQQVTSIPRPGLAANTITIPGVVAHGFVISGLAFQITQPGGATVNCAQTPASSIVCQ